MKKLFEATSDSAVENETAENIPAETEAPVVDYAAKKAIQAARNLFWNDAGFDILNAESFHKGFDNDLKAQLKASLNLDTLDTLFDKNTGLLLNKAVKETIIKKLDSKVGCVKALWKFYWLQFPYNKKTAEPTENEQLKEEIETKLGAINSVIEKGNVPFAQLTALFNIYFSIDKKMLVKYGKNLLNEIWDKIIGTITKTYDTLSKVETIQYFYNAYLAENHAKKALGLEFYNDDHDVLFGDYTQAKDDPDFKGLKIFNNSYTVEMKNYGTEAAATRYLNSVKATDRRKFHHSEFILCYIMSTGEWILAVNTPKPKEEGVVHKLSLGTVSGMVELSENSVIKVFAKPWESSKKETKETEETKESLIEEVLQDNPFNLDF